MRSNGDAQFCVARALTFLRCSGKSRSCKSQEHRNHFPYPVGPPGVPALLPNLEVLHGCHGCGRIHVRILECYFCKKCFKTSRPERIFCSRKCYRKGVPRLDKHHSWRGGRWVRSNPKSYIDLYKGNKTKVKEHRAIAENALGHQLPQRAEIHHWDDNKQNNASSNLVICQNHRYHRLLHARKRRFEQTGSLQLKKCSVCGIIKSLDDFHVDRTSWDEKNCRCKSCDSIKGMQWRKKHKRR